MIDTNSKKYENICRKFVGQTKFSLPSLDLDFVEFDKQKLPAFLP